MQVLDREVKIYDTGVEGGHLTVRQGCDWEDTLSNCEDTVTTTTFWGQITTYLSSMEYREGTVIGYFNKLFNLARDHFFPPVIVQVGTGKTRDFFVEKGRTVLHCDESVVVSIASQRKEDLFREYTTGNLS
jgi:hypothetical protein